MTRDPVSDFFDWVDAKSGTNLTVTILLLSAPAVALVGIIFLVAVLV